MGCRLLIVCVVLIYHIADNKYRCAANANTVHQMHGKAAHDSDILLDTSVHTRWDSAGGKNEIDPGADIKDERTNGLEVILNNLLQSQTEIQQNQNNIMHEFTKSVEVLTDEMNSIKAKVDQIESKVDQLKIMSESFETQMTTLVDASSRISSQLMLNENASRLMAKGIKDARRTTSLLAITKITTAELPYVAHCDRVIGGIEENNHIDACIQTRMAEFYGDLDSVLDVHVMLVGGRGPHEGRVEIIYQGIHGVVCGSKWSYNESKVVCRMLGYRGGVPIYNNQFGSGNSEILMNHIDCKGKEKSIFACNHAVRETVGIACAGSVAAVRCRL